MLKQQIIDFCNLIGLDTFGFIPCREFKESEDFFETRKRKKLQNEFEENDITKRINPNHYMKDGKTILSIAFPYYYGGQVDNGFSVYTKGCDYHRVVKQYLNRIKEYIESLGGKAEIFVDSNALPERYIAYLAGVGFIGRNNMLITEKYGSFVFLGEIITDLEIECEDSRSVVEIKTYKECKDCNACFEACPTKSINLHKVNPNICLSYLTQKKELISQEMNLLKGNVFGCDYCQRICPYNAEAQFSTIQEFRPYDFMNEEVFTYASMDNKFFKEKVSGTSCGWRGKNVIRRNAIISLYHNKFDIDRFYGESNYINKTIHRLVKKNKKYDTVIFDLDGTLLDTIEDLTDSVNYVMNQYQYPNRTIPEVKSFVGNGLKRLMELALPDGCDNPKFQEAYELLVKYYVNHSNIKTKPYDGIIELLKYLKNENYKLAIVSNKRDLAVASLNDIYFHDYIKIAIGENENIHKKPAPDTVLKAMKELGSKKEHTLYVGDSEVDKMTADHTGIDCVLVGWGFREFHVLEELHPKKVIEQPLKLLEILLNT